MYSYSTFGCISTIQAGEGFWHTIRLLEHPSPLLSVMEGAEENACLHRCAARKEESERISVGASLLLESVAHGIAGKGEVWREGVLVEQEVFHEKDLSLCGEGGRESGSVFEPFTCKSAHLVGHVPLLQRCLLSCKSCWEDHCSS
jgi:hypothetical protein